jgi:hypothetical protein
LGQRSIGFHNLVGTTEACPLKYGKDDVVAVPRFCTGNEALFAEVSFQRQTSRVKISLPSWPIRARCL